MGRKNRIVGRNAGGARIDYFALNYGGNFILHIYREVTMSIPIPRVF